VGILGHEPALGGNEAVQTEHSMRQTQLLKRMWHEEAGQDLIEYALIAMLVALIAIAGLNNLAGKISSYYTSIGNGM
jgi:Flp pilus assembly pilin Flp